QGEKSGGLLDHHGVARGRLEAARNGTPEDVGTGRRLAVRSFVHRQIVEAEPVFSIGAEAAVAFDLASGIEAFAGHGAFDVEAVDRAAPVDRANGLRIAEEDVARCVSRLRGDACRSEGGAGGVLARRV